MMDVMSTLLNELFRSPRLKVFHDQIAERLRQEQIARTRFRDEMTEDTRAEFINGEVVVQSPSRFAHNTAAERVYRLLDAHASANQLGHVGHEKYLVGLTRNDVEPDVCFWNKVKASKFTPKQLIFPTPDLVVEVLSDSTEKIDRGTKFEDYAAHGVIEYWIVDADNEVLEQYVLAGDAYELRIKSADGTVRSVAMPGAEFAVRAIFDDEENRRAVSSLLR